MSVLVTRPQPDADAFVAECRACGLDAAAAPLMRIDFATDWALPDNAAALAFTSANGVRAFVLNDARRMLPAYCVGEATARLAEAEGFEQVVVAEGDVDALGALITAQPPVASGPVIHIGGARMAGDLPGALAAAQIPATRIVAYETREASELPEPAGRLLKAGGPADVALFSPRTAALFVALVEKAGLQPALSNCRAVCLSDAVARAAGDGWREARIADGRSAAAMLAILDARA